MILNSQIKKYRERDQLSQEELAEKIYVSRQTISNWENEKSYPDIHNLLLLSVLFGVSLDELVKGDLDIMKKEVERNNLNFWSQLMTVFMLLTPLSIAPSLKFFNNAGLVIPLFCGIFMMFAAFKVEKMKKQNRIQTYSEIVAYMESREADPEKVQKERRHLGRNQTFMAAGCAAIAILLVALSFWIFF